jgi:hypothetical protein
MNLVQKGTVDFEFDNGDYITVEKPWFYGSGVIIGTMTFDVDTTIKSMNRKTGEVVEMKFIPATSKVDS